MKKVRDRNPAFDMPHSRMQALAVLEAWSYCSGVVDAFDQFDAVVLWHVKGSEGAHFDTKELAERWARDVFPEEDPDKRYARIFYRTFYKEKT